MGRHSAAKADPEPGGVSVRLWVFIGVALAVLVGAAAWAVATPRQAVHTATPGGRAASTPPTGAAAPDLSTPPSGVVPAAPTATLSPSPAGRPLATPASTSASPVPPPPGSTALPSASVTPPAGAVVVRATSAETWQGGYNANYAVNNGTAAQVDAWTVVLTFSVPVSGQAWNAQPPSFQSTTTVTLTAATYNQTIAPGKAQSFGLQATNANGVTPVPVGCTVNGAACTG